jgi:hypothetical protein
MAYESRHDADHLGPLQADPAELPADGGRLASVADMVHLVGEREGLPAKRAAHLVVQRIEQAAPALYVTRPGDYAVPLAAGYRWGRRRISIKGFARFGRSGQAQAVDASRTGMAGALEALRDFWADDRAVGDGTRAQLDRLAMPLRSAAELFGYVVAPPVPVVRQVVPAHPAQPDKIQPAGGAWPHVPGAEWTDAERDALFRMRHQLRMTDQQIADAIGEKNRQNIRHQIGSPRAWKNPDDPLVWRTRLAWRPSVALLAACNLPLTPLQAVALAATKP